MLFLIEYDRARGKIITFRNFANVDRRTAEDARLRLELDLRQRDIEHEVVLLEAVSEATLRRSHRRYFEDPASISPAST